MKSLALPIFALTLTGCVGCFRPVQVSQPVGSVQEPTTDEIKVEAFKSFSAETEVRRTDLTLKAGLKVLFEDDDQFSTDEEREAAKVVRLAFIKGTIDYLIGELPNNEIDNTIDLARHRQMGMFNAKHKSSETVTATKSSYEKRKDRDVRYDDRLIRRKFD